MKGQKKNAKVKAVAKDRYEKEGRETWESCFKVVRTGNGDASLGRDSFCCTCSRHPIRWDVGDRVIGNGTDNIWYANVSPCISDGQETASIPSNLRSAGGIEPSSVGCAVLRCLHNRRRASVHDVS